MAKSRVHVRGATRGRLKPQPLGKGCSTFNKLVRKVSRRRVYPKLPGVRD
jgi:hypothetical protein